MPNSLPPEVVMSIADHFTFPCSWPGDQGQYIKDFLWHRLILQMIFKLSLVGHPSAPSF
jgi:hypothetical protein